MSFFPSGGYTESAEALPPQSNASIDGLRCGVSRVIRISVCRVQRIAVWSLTRSCVTLKHMSLAQVERQPIADVRSQGPRRQAVDGDMTGVHLHYSTVV